MSRPFTEVTGTITGNELHFRCPGCATPYAWFVDQLASLPDQSLADYCDQCGHGFRVGLGPNRPVAAQVPAPSAASMPTPPDVAAAVMGRYADAYIVARTVDGFGFFIKTIGIVIGLLIGLASLAIGSKGGPAIVFTVIGLATAAIITTILYILGTLASAQGQILKAALDSAVNSSPFLTNRDRAEVMSLPAGPLPTYTPAYQPGT